MWRKITKGILGLLVVIAMLFFLIFWKPSLLEPILQQRLPWIMEKVGLSFAYESYQIKLSSPSFWEKRVSLACQKCTIAQEGVFQVATSVDELSLEINVLNRPYYLQVFGPVAISELSISITSPTEESSEEDDTGPSLEDLWRIVNSIRVAPWKIERFHFSSRGEPDLEISGRLYIHQDEARKFHVQAQLKLPEGKDLYVELHPEKNEATRYRLVTRLQGIDKPQIYLDTAIYKEKNALVLASRGMIHYPLSVLKQVEISGCILQGDLRKGIERSHWQTRGCDIVLVPEYEELKKESLRRTLPENLRLNFHAAWDFNPDEPLSLGNIDAEVKFSPLRTHLWDFGGEVHLASRGRDLLTNFRAHSDIHLSVHDFDHLSQLLADTWFAVPAPFHTLKGKLGCEVKGEVSFYEERLDLPYQCFIDVLNKEQKMDITSEGALSWALGEVGKPKIVSNISLNEVRFALPNIGIMDHLPRLTRDPRFVHDLDHVVQHEALTEENDEEPAIDLFLTVKSQKPSEIVVPRLNAVFPIMTHLKTTPKDGLEGSIKTENIKLTVIRRDIDIEFAQLDFIKGSEDPELSGRASLERSDLTLFLDLDGTVSDPLFRLSSRPVLSEDEIFAHLVYGSDFGGLTIDDQQAVADTKAAVAEGAISIISMFYLASTPVESVAYNPATKEFRAQFRVGSSSTVTLGRGLEGESRIRYSRHIAGNWFFETEAQESDTSDSTRGIALLRWARRYF